MGSQENFHCLVWFGCRMGSLKGICQVRKRNLKKITGDG